MKHQKTFWVLALVLLGVFILTLPLIAQEEVPERTGFRPDAPTYAIRGPYPVGYHDFMIDHDERPLDGMMWYPALKSDGAEEMITYEVGLGDPFPEALNLWPGHALQEANPDIANGPYPLVVFSHGHGGTSLATDYFFEHLASHGFVVMTVDHPGNWIGDNMVAQTDPTLLEAFMDTAFASLVMRPYDMKRLIDYAEDLTSTEGDFQGLIDVDRVASSGYSLGGYTALATGGARFDFTDYSERCQAGQVNTDLAVTICGYQQAGRLEEEELQLMAVAELDVPSGEIWPSIGDDRVDAVVALAPGADLVSDPGLAAIEVPTMVLAGTTDHVVNPEFYTYRIYENVNTPDKALVMFENADHFVFSHCPPGWLNAAYGWCSDPVWSSGRAYDLTNHFATAFLKDVFYGDEEAHAALMPDAVTFPGITYQTTMQ